MGDHQIAARDLLWALGSCCALAGRPFDAQLVLQQVPPPHTLASLVSAARAFGLQARLRMLPLARLAGERGPLVLRLRGDEGASSLGLLVRVDDEAITWIPAGSHEPLTQDISSFAPAYGGEVVQLRRLPDPAPDADRSAPDAFGLRWFVPELMKQRKVWRDVLCASLLLQLLALACPCSRRPSSTRWWCTAPSPRCWPSPPAWRSSWPPRPSSAGCGSTWCCTPGTASTLAAWCFGHLGRAPSSTGPATAAWRKSRSGSTAGPGNEVAGAFARKLGFERIGEISLKEMR